MSDEKNWYAIYTKPRSEKRVGEELAKRKIEHYVPLQKVLRQWSDRKKWVVVPVFNSYAFVKIDLKNQLAILDMDNVINFVKFENKIPSIPEWQMNNLKIILDSSEKFEISSKSFVLGDKIEVSGGAFAGLSGVLVEYRGKQKVLVHIDVIGQSLMMEINPIYLKKVSMAI